MCQIFNQNPNCIKLENGVLIAPTIQGSTSDKCIWNFKQSLGWVQVIYLFFSFVFVRSEFCAYRYSPASFFCREIVMNYDFIVTISVYVCIFNAWPNCFIRLYVRYTSHNKSIVAGINYILLTEPVNIIIDRK